MQRADSIPTTIDGDKMFKKWDSFVDAGAVTGLVTQVREIQTALQNLSGSWATLGGEVYPFSETGSGIAIGNIMGSNPIIFGNLQRSGIGTFDGRLIITVGPTQMHCGLQLALTQSEDFMMLTGTASMLKRSDRACFRLLTKDVKNGAAFTYTLFRQ